MSSEAALPLAEWMEKLATPHGDPGGGAAGGVALAMAAALCEMVAGYPPTIEGDAAVLAAVRVRAAGSRARALDLAQADGAASAAFTEAHRFPDGPARVAAVARASLAATKTVRGDSPRGGRPS